MEIHVLRPLLRRLRGGSAKMIASIDTAPPLPEGIVRPSAGCATWEELEAALSTCDEFYWRQNVNAPWNCELHVPLAQYHRARAIVFYFVSAFIRVDIIPLIL